MISRPTLLFLMQTFHESRLGSLGLYFALNFAYSIQAVHSNSQKDIQDNIGSENDNNNKIDGCLESGDIVGYFTQTLDSQPEGEEGTRIKRLTRAPAPAMPPYDSMASYMISFQSSPVNI